MFVKMLVINLFYQISSPDLKSTIFLSLDDKYYIYYTMISKHNTTSISPKITSTSSPKTQQVTRSKVKSPQSYPRMEPQQSPKLTSLIGYDRLLCSMDKLTPILQTQCKGKERICYDRFIPQRKTINYNYKLKQNPQDQENLQEEDPQNLSISEIYSEQVLRNYKQRYFEEVNPFMNTNILQYKSKTPKMMAHEYSNPLDLYSGSYHKIRKISKIPCKVLDAPALQDDFYLNLVDWSQQNQLAVGLGNCIYLWNAFTSKVTKLCELHNDLVTSVSWAADGLTLSVGCNRGDVLIWDVNNTKQVRKMGGHQIRVGAMGWNKNMLATGSRDKSILYRDTRCRRQYINKLTEHNQEICGLKWSLDDQYLASGGNDNKVAVWTMGGQLINKFTDHKAAVKALSWSTQQHGLLATGGGTADRMLRMRNIFDGKVLCEKDTGSQVCNIAFSKNLHEIVSTHGYSQNEINIWQYPTMKKVATLIGHTHRVLYLAMSPDGSTIVTGAGDETLRFWNIFPNSEEEEKKAQSVSLIKEGFKLR